MVDLKTFLQDIREGQGPTPSEGSNCSIDWDGYTIGYYVGHLKIELAEASIHFPLGNGNSTDWELEEDYIALWSAR